MVHDTWFRDRIICPHCRRKLDASVDNPVCLCGFAATAGTPLDLRPRALASRTLEVPVGPAAAIHLDPLPLARPEVTYRGPRALRDSSELFSAVAPWVSPGKRMLDLGCGPRDQAVPALHLGMLYVGLDFDSPQADLLADAHAIPFEDQSFDAVLAYAVVEHLYNPVLALTEIRRVLRPGGVFFGAVSQGEPYHQSYFHHTPLGVASAFLASGLTLQRMWATEETLHSLAVMGRYSRPVRLLLEVLHRCDRALPFLAPRAWLRASPREKQWNELCRAGSIAFVALRPA